MLWGGGKKIAADCEDRFIIGKKKKSRSCGNVILSSIRDDEVTLVVCINGKC